AAPSPAPSTNTTNPGPTMTGENVFDEAAAAGNQGTQVGGGNIIAAGRNIGGGGRVFTGDPISLNLKDADIKDVLRTFAQLTGLNIAVDPQVSGSVTVDFVDVPWDQALDLILRQNGLSFALEGNVMRVGTIDRLAQETAASRKLAEEERLSVPTTTLSFKLSYARAQEVANLLKDIASPRARIIVDARTNQLIVSEIPQYLQVMRGLIDTVDIPNRQVVIEARIVETTKIYNLQYGFSWSFNGLLDPALGTGTGLIFPNRVGFTGGPFSFTGGAAPILGLTLTDVLGTFNLDLAIAAAETNSLLKVISAPKVTTQDNTPAEIQSGVQIPYQTRVNFTTTVQYIDATLRLSVTPQITEAGTIIMDISVQKTTPGQPIEGAAGTPLQTRQARTRVMVRDGGTAVIGGIYQASDTSASSGIPILKDIPVLGALFKSHSNNTQHDELLIFITPRIVRGS
ncbi:MAG TPA: type IV pilus secretin PilQ, partial [Thermoanaerobaculia bacterium]